MYGQAAIKRWRKTVLLISSPSTIFVIYLQTSASILCPTNWYMINLCHPSLNQYVITFIPKIIVFSVVYFLPFPIDPIKIFAMSMSSLFVYSFQCSNHLHCVISNLLLLLLILLLLFVLLLDHLFVFLFLSLFLSGCRGAHHVVLEVFEGVTVHFMYVFFVPTIVLLIISASCGIQINNFSSNMYLLYLLLPWYCSFYLTESNLFLYYCITSSLSLSHTHTHAHIHAHFLHSSHMVLSFFLFDAVFFLR